MSLNIKIKRELKIIQGDFGLNKGEFVLRKPRGILKNQTSS